MQWGTFILVLSRWLDYKLKKLLPFISTYIKDSRDFEIKLDNLNSNGRLPKMLDWSQQMLSWCIQILIDTDHGLKVLRSFLEELRSEDNLHLILT